MARRRRPWPFRGASRASATPPTTRPARPRRAAGLRSAAGLRRAPPTKLRRRSRPPGGLASEVGSLRPRGSRALQRAAQERRPGAWPVAAAAQVASASTVQSSPSVSGRGLERSALATLRAVVFGNSMPRSRVRCGDARHCGSACRRPAGHGLRRDRGALPRSHPTSDVGHAARLGTQQRHGAGRALHGRWAADDHDCRDGAIRAPAPDLVPPAPRTGAPRRGGLRARRVAPAAPGSSIAASWAPTAGDSGSGGRIASRDRGSGRSPPRLTRSKPRRSVARGPRRPLFCSIARACSQTTAAERGLTASLL